ncbi:hypothetical protein HW452_05300 [Halomonas aquamarina]|uniref:Uncharacterized protein n=1 Tax=Vreelandella aquamarina TaxID=77097 RepID=A0ACC5VS21_9GAMM|nr:hypothetical protein [Halomonas aquamarina]MBZ5486938.1 hypothetical protein [Halomonas aquamarina]
MGSNIGSLYQAYVDAGKERQEKMEAFNQACQKHKEAKAALMNGVAAEAGDDSKPFTEGDFF